MGTGKKCPKCDRVVPMSDDNCSCGFVFSKASLKALQGENKVERVVITDIQMSFGSMVVFMVGWALASIPAFIILFLFGLVAFVVLGAIGITAF